MDPTPAPIEEFKLNPVEDYCDEPEKQNRIEKCKVCDFFVEEPTVTKCSQCDCTIGFITSFKFKACPIGKW